MNNNPDRRRTVQKSSVPSSKNTPKPSVHKSGATRSAIKKKQLSPKEKAILTERKRVESIRRKRQIKILLDKAAAIGVFSAIGALVAFAIIFGVLFFDFRVKDDIPEQAVTVTLSDEKKHVLSENFYSYRNGEYYVSLSKLCELCPITLHGDVKNMTLSLSDGSYASFDIGTNVVNVCGTNCIMQSPSYFEFEQFFIPCSFFTRFCSGVEISHNERGKDEGFNIIFDDIFSTKAISNNAAFPSPVSNFDFTASSDSDGLPVFKADLSDYEQYMNPENADEYLTVINSSHSLSADYVPSDLIEVKYTLKDGRAPQKMRLYAAKALEAMFIEMNALGFSDISVISGYKSYEYQKNLLDNEIQALTKVHGENAEALAKKRIAMPGTSEHQSGLCADISNSHILSEAFEKQDVYKWIYSNCADFGFILRYPKDKTHITGTGFEPWHFRYVGRYHARQIMSEGISLEEYISNN